MKSRKNTLLLCLSLFLCLTFLLICSTGDVASPASAVAAETGTAVIPGDNWEPTLEIEQVSPTGAMILFQNADIPGDYLILSGNDYSLQTWKDGSWQELTATQDQVYWVKDAFVISAVPRDDIDWEWLYGSLPAGHYRIAKNIALAQNDQILDRSTVYAEFILEAPGASDETASSSSETIAQYDMQTYEYSPLTSETAYTYTEALNQHVVILENGSAIENQDVWYSFAQVAGSGQPATVRCIQLGDDYGFPSVYDVSYDGLHYTMRWFENGAEQSLSFKNMVRYLENPDSNTLVRYVLVMDRNTAWEDIEWGMIANTDLLRVPHLVVYQVLRYIPSHPPIPENSSILLTLRGNTLLTPTDTQTEQLTALFSEARYVPEAPETTYKGLDVTFTDEQGHSISLWLCQDADYFLYNGSFFSYDHTEFLSICGLSQWPE